LQPGQAALQPAGRSTASTAALASQPACLGLVSVLVYRSLNMNAHRM
jgi:hypothetical protein